MGLKSNVLCADIGTTSLKAAVVDISGNIISYSQQFFPFTDSATVAKHWLPALLSAWNEMCSEMKTNAGDMHIDGICISGNGPTVVAHDGRTLLWNAPVSTHLTDGTLVAKSLFLPRIVSFLERYPDIQLGEKYLYSGPEFLIYELTGNSVTILPEERYRTAYWTDEQVQFIYDKRLLIDKNDAPILLEKLLPSYVEPGTLVGLVLPDISNQFGFTNPVPVFGGGPDFIAAMVGTNSLAGGKWYDCAGSSEGLNLCSTVARSFGGLRLLPSVSHALWNIAALEVESGRMFHNYKQVAESLTGKKFSYAELIDRCLDDKGSEGFEVLSFIADNFHRMVQSIMDVATTLNIELAPYITVTGGQAKNERWMQFKCNAAKVPLAVCNHEDAELIGDTVLAQKGLGNFDSIEQAANAIVKITKMYTPA